jgi:acyl-CoA thioesterase
MTEFTELLNNIKRADDAWTIDVSDDWQQGRTIYGGLAAALCLEATLRAFPDLPPLRSAQFAFIGPATGELRICPSVLRKGKSTVFTGVDLFGDADLATRATLCFGSVRESALAYDAITAPAAKAPDQCPDFFRNAPPGLRFLAHIDGRAAAGSLPFSSAANPDMTLWLRHRDPALKPSLVSLLALADAPPPAALAMADQPGGAISTMTWSIDMLTDAAETEDGWWLVRTVADKVGGGYSSQSMTVWNTAGDPVMASRQNVAMFMGGAFGKRSAPSS